MQTRTLRWRQPALAAAYLSACLSAGSALAAGTPDPGDYAPAPAGSTVIAVYAQHMTGNREYASGRQVADGIGLKLDVGIVRAMHYLQIAGMPADLEVILPMGRQRIGVIDDKQSGLGNLNFGATIWPFSDEASGRHWGIASYISAPTGQNRHNGFGLSENRYAWDIETGYITPLGQGWSLDLIGQLEIYSKERTTDVRRRPMLRGFAHLSYALSEQSKLALSVRQTAGMKETLNGSTTLGSRRDTNLTLSWQQWLGESTQLQVQYQRDVKVRNGTPLSGWQLRLVQLF